MLGVPVCPCIPSPPLHSPFVLRSTYLSRLSPGVGLLLGSPLPPRLPTWPGVPVNPTCPGVQACHWRPARPSLQGAASPEGSHYSLGSPLTPGWCITPQVPTHYRVPSPLWGPHSLPRSPRCSIAPGSLLPPGPPRGPRTTPVPLGTLVPRDAGAAGRLTVNRGCPGWVGISHRVPGCVGWEVSP